MHAQGVLKRKKILTPSICGRNLFNQFTACIMQNKKTPPSHPKYMLKFVAHNDMCSLIVVFPAR